MGWWLKVDGGLRILIGAVVAQTVGCMVCAAALVDWDIGRFLLKSLQFLMLSAPLLVVLLFVFAVVRHFRLNRLWHYLVGGPLLLMTLVVLIFAAFPASSAPSFIEFFIESAFAVGLPMLVASASFWMVAVWNNPAAVSQKSEADPTNGLLVLRRTLFGVLAAQLVGCLIASLGIRFYDNLLINALHLGFISYPLIVFIVGVGGIMFAAGHAYGGSILGVIRLHDVLSVALSALFASGVFWAIAIRPAGFPLSRE